MAAYSRPFESLVPLLAGLVVVLMVSACGDEASPDSTNNGSNNGANNGSNNGAGSTLSFQFDATTTVRTSPNLADPLAGDIYGSIFKTEDVSVTGPRDEAVAVADVEVSAADMVEGPTEVLWTQDGFAPGLYTFLGFFDVDGNGAVERDPDAGDPVTFPVANQFEVIAGEDLELVVSFDLVLN